METKIRVFWGLGMGMFLIIAGYSHWSNHKIAKLEHLADEAKQNAEVQEQRATELEAAARKYEEKIAYLEANLAESQTIARKQDEELKSIETNTGNARRDVERARRVRSAAATAGEVCRKLEELGHACQ